MGHKRCFIFICCQSIVYFLLFLRINCWHQCTESICYIWFYQVRLHTVTRTLNSNTTQIYCFLISNHFCCLYPHFSSLTFIRFCNLLLIADTTTAFGTLRDMRNLRIEWSVVDESRNTWGHSRLSQPHWGWRSQLEGTLYLLLSPIGLPLSPLNYHCELSLKTPEL